MFNWSHLLGGERLLYMFLAVVTCVFTTHLVNKLLIECSLSSGFYVVPPFLFGLSGLIILYINHKMDHLDLGVHLSMTRVNFLGLWALCTGPLMMWLPTSSQSNLVMFKPLALILTSLCVCLVSFYVLLVLLFWGFKKRLVENQAQSHVLLYTVLAIGLTFGIFYTCLHQKGTIAEVEIAKQASLNYCFEFGLVLGVISGYKLHALKGLASPDFGTDGDIGKHHPVGYSLITADQDEEEWDDVV